MSVLLLLLFWLRVLPSGKLTVCYGKSLFSMGKSRSGFCLLGIDGGAKMLEHMGVSWTIHGYWLVPSSSNMAS